MAQYDSDPHPRRDFLRAGAYAACSLALLAPASLIARAPPAAGATPSAQAHVALCRFLCGFPKLDPHLVARAFAALSATDRGFVARAEALRLAITTAGLPDVQAFRDSPLYADATHRATALGLLGAFYLGVVGTGDAAHLIAYEASLMFAPTQNVTPIPSYACGGPGYWALIDVAAPG
jgi:hypothetical protein